MVILIDTNIVLDIIQERQPYCIPAAEIFKMCATKKATGYIAIHSISNIFFILRKSYTADERRKILKDILKIFTVAGTSHQGVLEALEKDEFKDFEDCLQDECAREVGADYIITRNVQDFRYAEVKAITAVKFLEIMDREIS